jgi:hypothetical protein
MAVKLSPSSVYPKLRPVDIRPHTHNGQPYYMLRDPLQLSDRLLVVPQLFGALLAFCDGAHSLQEVTQAISRHYGAPIPASLVEQLVTAMDEALLLDNERTAEAVRQARMAYRAAPCRPPLLAGQSYPAHAE